ncbi:hypothetical protein [Jiangella alkaliphila]|uniref:ABC-2 type transport system permease protein n=1 Tax=Jiangella alkaliphila TaxID=419479 RepID=A0A1H2JKD6_9ACTN|nr:hypothetical protein [Jiangella alkaliphila]SDU56596.1 hypothetical protein SAMN04488563_2776 [Jiangella alkaliphila]
MNRLAAVARGCLREVSRRRGVIVLLVLLPLVFYLVRRDLQGQSIRMLALGLGWTVSTLALFVTVSARGVDQRLRLAGYSAQQLVVGRTLAITLCGLPLAALYGLLIAVDQDVNRLWAAMLLLATTTVIAAPLGAVIAAVLPRDLEGALALLAILSTQLLADPGDRIAVMLPFWSTREIGTYAIDGTGDDYLGRGLTHFAVTWVTLFAVAMAVSAVRLRLARIPVPGPLPN